MIKLTHLAIASGLFMFSGTDAHSNDNNELEQFVKAMVELKRAGATCETFVAGSPLSQMNDIDAFFAVLGQPIPAPIDAATKSSLEKLVKQHAAYICSQKLARAEQQYLRAGALYMQSKPENWPAAPNVQLSQWCQNSDCAEYQ